MKRAFDSGHDSDLFLSARSPVRGQVGLKMQCSADDLRIYQNSRLVSLRRTSESGCILFSVALVEE